MKNISVSAFRIVWLLSLFATQIGLQPVQAQDSASPQPKKAAMKEAAKNRSNNETEPKKFTRRPTPKGAVAHFDLQYAEIEGEALVLDLYLPEKKQKEAPPLVLWIHGGGWKNGDKVQFNPGILRLSADNFAVASINYRLGGLGSHPKQIHDCKGALRWLRAHAAEYGYDPDRVAVGGGSAGGHLALLLGLSGDIEEMEGTIGGNLNFSGPVQAILDFYGPADLTLMPKSKATLVQNKDVLESASPIRYLDVNDPPILIFQGDKDKTVSPEQSLLLHDRCQKAGISSELHIIEGAGHGGVQFSDEKRYGLFKAFLQEKLGN